MATLSGGYWIVTDAGDDERGPFDTQQEATEEAQELADSLKCRVWVVEHIYEYSDSEGVCYCDPEETEGD